MNDKDVLQKTANLVSEMPELTITDTLESVPGREEEVLKKLKAVTEGERRVGPSFGMTRFDLHRHKTNPALFLLYENWTTQAGFNEYHKSHRPPELSSFLEEAGELLLQAPEDVSMQWEMISKPEENVAGRIAIDFLDALAVSDADAIAKMWTDDAVLEFPFAPPEFPSKIKGQPDIEQYFRDALGAVNPIAYPNRVVTPFADPLSCLIEFDSQLTVGDDPKIFENSYITIVRVRNGKIAYFKEHYDSVKRREGFPSANEIDSGNSESPHSLSVELKAKRGKEDQLAEKLMTVSKKAIHDNGNQFYRVFRSGVNDANFTIIEAWDRKADFEAHLNKDWVKRVNEELAGLIDGEPLADEIKEL